MIKIAILDDYSGAALSSADWSPLTGKAEITVFDRHLDEQEAAVVLKPFDVVCTMRERMALPRDLFAQLPNLKLVTIVGMTLPNLDMTAATEHGVIVAHSNFRITYAQVANATPEFAWGLLIATVRHITHENRRIRDGGWQSTVGDFILAGRTLGLVGLGRVGMRMAEYGRAFGMDVIAWSQNLTEETASAAGVRRVDKDNLFMEADVVSIHVILSSRTRGLVTARELGLMKPHAYLINTSRGPIVDEAALIAALRARRLAGAGLDVFDVEPLPVEHPFRSMDNVTVTPHIGYVTREAMRAFYGETVEAVTAFVNGSPIRVANPEALHHEKQRRSIQH